MSAAIAAAVCWRRAETLELLLVRTKGGKRWTFPKGHREAGETLAEAARREAAEEAGVVDGELDEKPLADFRYPSGPKGTAEDVAAFTLRVDRLDPQRAERKRHPVWVRPAEAARLLADGRAPEFGAELAAVVTAAVARLESAG